MSDFEAIATPWARASLAATLFALNPLCSGLLIRAAFGPAREALLEQIAAQLGPVRMTRIPAEIADDRLIGGLDVAATLKTGKPVAEAGVLAGADGGVIVVAMAERMRTSVAARLAAALDRGEVALQRDGLSLTFPAHIGVIALDEGGPDEAAPGALAERLAFWVDLEGVQLREIEPSPFSAPDLDRARRLKIKTSEEALGGLVGIALQLGVSSLRGPLLALHAARGLAALRGAAQVEAEDVQIAAALVLGPRATRMPAPPPEKPEQEPAPEPPEPQEAEGETPRELEDKVLEAAGASIPPGLLAALAFAVTTRTRSADDGKSGEETIGAARGRPMDARPGPLSRGRLALVATLRAAAPWRKLRDPEGGRRVIVQPGDFRIQRYRRRKGAAAIFVVDASGSLAMNRLAEVKGAIELLLADCYARRDHVALIAFRGKEAEIALPPTRATASARRALTGLPGGGGTPIASGLDAAWALADQSRRKGQTPLIVLMTDGRANIARDGKPGRPQAMKDALEAAKRISAERFSALAIDTSPPPLREDAPVRALAEAMSARYIRLPLADAAKVNAAVRAAMAP